MCCIPKTNSLNTQYLKVSISEIHFDSHLGNLLDYIKWLKLTTVLEYNIGYIIK